MARILVAECKQEVSSFNPVASTLGDFTTSAGDALLAWRRGSRSELGGALAVFDADEGLSITAGYGAAAITSGGILTAEAWARLRRDFLQEVEASAASPPHGIYYSLHGAMAAEDEDDPEGLLLAETRRLLGEDVPIVVSMDLHGILTDRILRHSDAVVVYHTYPHVDFVETGERAARLLLKLVRGEAAPVTAVVPVPALVRGDELKTETGLIRHVVSAARELESGPGGLSAGMFWGNPFTDVPELRSNSLVVLDRQGERAAAEAQRLAGLFWEHHERMFQPLLSLEDAAAAAMAVRDGTAILVDAADATSSGASGDSNAVVRALLAAGYPGTVLAPVVDPPAAAAAHAAGAGVELEVTLGGAMDRTRFEPLPVRARVRVLSDGHFYSETFRAHWYAGPTAVLEAGPVTWVVTSRPVSLYDRALFLAHGQDPQRYGAVVVKSPHCEHRFYEAWAARMIHVDAPGSTSANLRRLGHTRCSRPVFPLDESVPFENRARLYCRPRYRAMVEGPWN